MGKQNKIGNSSVRPLTPVEKLQIKAMIKKEVDLARQETMEKAYLYMLAIPLNVLLSDYWPKASKEKTSNFIDATIKLYESVQAGVVSNEELRDLLEEHSGVHIDASWLKPKDDK